MVKKSNDRYEPVSRFYEFEPVPNIETRKQLIDEFSKRTGISKKDTRIFFNLFMQFFKDALISGSCVNFGIFRLLYRYEKPRKANILGKGIAERSAVSYPSLRLSRRIGAYGIQKYSHDEWKQIESRMKENDDD